MKRLELKDGFRKIKIDSVKQLGFFEKGYGLMFQRREKARALLFNFKKPVSFHLTSLFVFFPFLVLWMDENNKILEKKIVKPWIFAISPSVKNYKKILEVPLNDFYLRKVKNIVGAKDLNTF
jgi:uncharacterized membrane protein (UPF0127 family)